MTCLLGVSARHFEAVGLRTLSLTTDSMIDVAISECAGEFVLLTTFISCQYPLFRDNMPSSQQLRLSLRLVNLFQEHSVYLGACRNYYADNVGP